jgi:hypothetical protein
MRGISHKRRCWRESYDKQIKPALKLTDFTMTGKIKFRVTFTEPELHMLSSPEARRCIAFPVKSTLTWHSQNACSEMLPN